MASVSLSCMTSSVCRECSHSRPPSLTTHCWTSGAETGLLPLMALNSLCLWRTWRRVYAGGHWCGVYTRVASSGGCCPGGTTYTPRSSPYRYMTSSSALPWPQCSSTHRPSGRLPALSTPPTLLLNTSPSLSHLNSPSFTLTNQSFSMYKPAAGKIVSTARLPSIWNTTTTYNTHTWTTHTWINTTWRKH